MHVPGRGATINPRGRFERLEVALEEEAEHEAGRPRTVYLRDDSQSIISTNDSPDIGFRSSFNPYRGCEHGCSYCYARPYHEYLGFSAGQDFETKIMVKPDAAKLLRKALSSPKWQPEVLAISGVTDCYQPVERKLEITRQCLEVLAEFRNPCVIVTKNHLVTRDIDHLRELAALQAAMVFISVTTLDTDLAAALEPRAATPAFRLDAIRQLAEAGIPVGVLTAPVIPGLNEHEIPAILKAAREAGAGTAGYSVIRLPYGVKDVFAAWLETHRPGSREKILDRIRDMRGGQLNRSDFATRMRGEGIWAEQIRQLFRSARQREGLEGRRIELSVDHFRRPGGEQLRLL